MAGLLGGVNEINRAVGQAVVDVAQALAAVHQLRQVLLDTGRGYGQANLVAMGMAAGDVTTILNSLGDLDNLYAVAHGQQAQPGASDFFFNAKQLAGLAGLT